MKMSTFPEVGKRGTCGQMQKESNEQELISELRQIKWLLYAILLMLVTFAVYTLPKDWWYTGWL